MNTTKQPEGSHGEKDRAKKVEGDGAWLRVSLFLLGVLVAFGGFVLRDVATREELQTATPWTRERNGIMAQINNNLKSAADAATLAEKVRDRHENDMRELTREIAKLTAELSVTNERLRAVIDRLDKRP